MGFWEIGRPQCILHDDLGSLAGGVGVDPVGWWCVMVLVMWSRLQWDPASAPPTAPVSGRWEQWEDNFGCCAATVQQEEEEGEHQPGAMSLVPLFLEGSERYLVRQELENPNIVSF